MKLHRESQERPILYGIIAGLMIGIGGMLLIGLCG